MQNRKAVLEQLLLCPDHGRLRDVTAALQQFPWDCNEPLVTLTRPLIESILSRYVHSELTSADVEEWANLVEGRDDIKFEPGNEDTVGAIMHELANPFLTEPLTQKRAEFLIQTVRDK
ncbi:MAG TPA: hypothetical protein VFT64_04455 [Rickettsiales bacterium]|nr:hypothetical protein [Rickettsiales bacterium]